MTTNNKQILKNIMQSKDKIFRKHIYANHIKLQENARITVILNNWEHVDYPLEKQLEDDVKTEMILKGFLKDYIKRNNDDR